VKKVFKWIAISLLSILFLLVFIGGITVWFVFTPDKLTPVVRSQSAKYLKCETLIDEVELTFFSTFPQFGLKVNHFVLINPISGAQSDTLFMAGQLSGLVELSSWLNRKELILSDLRISDGQLNIFADSLGHTNYDIVKSDTASNQKDSSTSFKLIHIEQVELEHVDFSYIDHSLKIVTQVRNLDAELSGEMIDNKINSSVVIDHGNLSLKYNGVDYLINSAIAVQMNSQADLGKLAIDFKTSELSVNQFNLAFNGSVQYDTVKSQIITDLNYQLKYCSIAKILK